MTEGKKFNEEYNKLNKAQKEAVDSTDGPVMVVAGPGTGKTQIIALRIGNILLKTDTKPDEILCLTFTNSGVSAMKERLRKYIGATGSKVNIFTFHSFGMKIIEEYYSLLDLETAPKLLDEIDVVALCDQILHDNDWSYIRPRSDASLYFRDLKSLISLLKRERLSPAHFLKEIEKDVGDLKNNEENISTRGESKGQIKKEVLKKMESLERTREVVKFYELYEKAKAALNLFDYDDVLENLVRIVEKGDEARDEIREKYLYVLIDEHQDSSGVQNEFLFKVWGKVEKPNIFVVGDDRQLIYGFGGASLAYFEAFKHSFGKAKLITLVDNYRSTQAILDSAHILLESSITKERLKSKNENKNKLKNKKSHPIRLVEADYPRDEIIACALDIKEKIKKDLDVNDCAILVPKNKQVRSAVAILRDLGLPVSAFGTLRLFDSPEAQSYLLVLKIVSNPYDNVALALSFFDKLSGIEPLSAHKFIAEHDMRKLSLVNLAEEKKQTLFQKENAVKNWIEKLSKWLKDSQTVKLYSLLQLIGDEFLLNQAKDHQTLMSAVEIIRTILHLALSAIEKPARPSHSGGNPKLTLKEFLAFIDRLESYDENIPLAVFAADQGVKVLTLHSSKGLEFDYVWIAHMDEKSLVSGRRQGFTIPESIREKIEEKDEAVFRRQLYVAMTRAKRFCTLSYAKHSYIGNVQELAHIVSDLVADLPPELFKKQTSIETEKIILSISPKAYIKKGDRNEKNFSLNELSLLASKEYEERKVSVSLLNNFFECPWKWYFRNLLNLPESKTESLEFGTAVHGCIDSILKMKTKPTASELEKIVKIEVSKREFSNGRKEPARTTGVVQSGGEKIQKEVLSVISKWVKNRLPEISPNHENEKSISVKDDKFPHLHIYGKIDLIEHLSPTEFRVTDFKTGSVRKKGDIEKLDEENRMSSFLRQLAIYSYLVEQSSKNKLGVTESRLEFLEAKDPKEAFYDKIITQKEIGLLIKDISDYANLVKSGEWINRPCNYNSYDKNTECEYCKLSEIYLI